MILNRILKAGGVSVYKVLQQGGNLLCLFGSQQKKQDFPDLKRNDFPGNDMWVVEIL